MITTATYKYSVSRDLYNLNNLTYKIFYESDREFEDIREYCLSEQNWLSENYTKENLKIEDHQGYCVVFDKTNGEPTIMGGVFNDGRYPNYVARILNRLYVFPKYRTNASTMIDGCIMVHQRLTLPLIAANNFDLYFTTMQNRNKPSKGWWQIWKRAMQAGSNDFWKEKDGYIQGCPWNVQKCWQNFVYHEITEGSFNRWNPEILDHDQWLKLEKGV